MNAAQVHIEADWAFADDRTPVLIVLPEAIRFGEEPELPDDAFDAFSAAEISLICESVHRGRKSWEAAIHAISHGVSHAAAGAKFGVSKQSVQKVNARVTDALIFKLRPLAERHGFVREVA